MQELIYHDMKKNIAISREGVCSYLMYTRVINNEKLPLVGVFQTFILIVPDQAKVSCRIVKVIVRVLNVMVVYPMEDTSDPSDLQVNIYWYIYTGLNIIFQHNRLEITSLTMCKNTYQRRTFQKNLRKLKPATYVLTGRKSSKSRKCSKRGDREQRPSIRVQLLLSQYNRCCY